MISAYVILIAAISTSGFVSASGYQYGRREYTNRYENKRNGAYTVGDVDLASRGEIKNSCNSGPIQCCQQVYKSDSDESNLLRSLVGVDVGDINALTGLSCSPISVVGVGNGVGCSSQPVCCTRNHMRGLVAVGCSPINVKA